MAASNSLKETRDANAMLSRDAAVALCDELSSVMDELIDTVERETDLVHVGKLLEAGALAPQKAVLSQSYTSMMLRVKHHAEAMKAFAPEELGRLQRKHNLFRALLKINLGVLGTAREVSSEIMETLATAVGKNRKATTHGTHAVMPRAPDLAVEGVALDGGI